MNKTSKKSLLPINVNVVFEGRFVIMRPISMKEVNEKYVSWLNDPRINRFLEVRHKKQSIEDIINYVNGLRSQEGCEVFAIFTKEENVHVGNIAITEYYSNNSYATYGILIGDEVARMLGVGSEASIFTLEYFFRVVKIRRIWGRVLAGNERSRRLVESLGFIREGTQRKHCLLSTGKPVDVYLYGILREEWLEHRKKFKYVLKHIKIKEINKKG